MSKYVEVQNRLSSVKGYLRRIKGKPSTWLIDAAYSTSDRDMEYHEKLRLEHELYIEAVTEILEDQRKADQAKIDAIEELLSD
ncbi:hypothetical protein [Alteromonas sp. BMJM2]|uniref:hypothetical protein n=1 Tax=Alteromonas sp. BMJM2 TaxID=2954241 RepID=UPI0022B40D85|nr:hypothetical protein [Alteromonas sp. BMJM2]